MADASKIGTDWQADELDAIVATYFDMLRQGEGRRGWKVERIRRLDADLQRGVNSIGRKLSNISFLAHGDLGLPKLPGFGGLPNAQRAIVPAIERYLEAHPEVWEIGLDRALGEAPHSSSDAGEEPVHGPSDQLRAKERPSLFRHTPLEETRPPPLSLTPKRRQDIERLVQKFDPAGRDARNRALARVGEQHVYEHEIARLVTADRMDLAKRVEWTSEERGDGAGYDVLSFDPASGQERFIEVKTTRGGPRTDFFLSRNERAFSDEEPERFRLYRLYEAAADVKLFALRPPLEASVRLSPETWRAGF